MSGIENMYPTVKTVNLDTPAWNIRTNSFYKELGYLKEKEEDGFVFYKKVINR